MSTTPAGFLPVVTPFMGLGAILLAGCAARPAHRATEGDARIAASMAVDVHDLAMFDGSNGAEVSWNDLLARIDAAEVIVIGEQHDDAVGHRVQHAILTDVFARAGSAAASHALSMEMLERDEQAIVDDYLGGFIDRDRFIEETASTRWRAIAADYLRGDIERSAFETRITSVGWFDWDAFYQPSIDLAKEANARVIAANAPWARYTSLITHEDGYAKLDGLSPAQRDLVAWPEMVPAGSYRERFWQFMAGRGEGEPPAPRPAHQPADPHMGEFTDEQVLTGLMKQMVYDATMADSIARALDSGATRVIHLVGQFHSDFDGGTVIEIRRRAPAARVMTLSLVPEGGGTILREEDRGRADVVVYTR